MKVGIIWLNEGRNKGMKADIIEVWVFRGEVVL